MSESSSNSRAAGALVLGVFILLGLSAFGYLAGSAARDIKSLARSVTVKGLSEREYAADVVIWPIQFTEAGNNLEQLYGALESTAGKIRGFLQAKGIDSKDITLTVPVVTDKSAEQWGDNQRPEFRYTAVQTVTVYSADVGTVRNVMESASELGKEGIVLSGGIHGSQADYLFTRLSEVKPAMIEEATLNARETAQKFAQDSDSELGKIKRASQGLFSIDPRDRNNPHIKKVRVVSTIEYYLVDSW